MAWYFKARLKADKFALSGFAISQVFAVTAALARIWWLYVPMIPVFLFGCWLDKRGGEGERRG